MPIAPIRPPNTSFLFDIITARVHRVWEPSGGKLYWKLKKATYGYSIEDTKGRPKPASSLRTPQGIFRPNEQEKLTLEDFVYVYSEERYVHLPTNARLTGRQINRIFPDPITIHKEGKSDKPLLANYFIRRHAKLNFLVDLNLGA